MELLPELNTERLRLREIALADAPAIQAYQNCEQQWRLQAMEPEELADSKLRIRRYFEHRGQNHERRLFVYVGQEKATGKLIGQVSLSRSHPAIAHIGIGVDHRRWRQGFGLEMALGMIRFGFGEISLNRIVADVSVENEHCIRMLQRAGMQREGVARECIWAQGRWWTEAQLAILRRDFDQW